MADRRRINGPPSGTRPPVFVPSLKLLDQSKSIAFERPSRTRSPRELRKIYLKTGIIPSASGSAYHEVQLPVKATKSRSLISPSSSLKLICSVNGPKPLPRSAPFSPNLLLSAHVKFAPFAGRRRRGYIRDVTERDLGVHLENALRGAIIAERWPKSGLDVTVTILEGEDDRWWGDMLTAEHLAGSDGWGTMNVLANCITVASAAIADARIDCLDLVAGGVAAIAEDKLEEDTNTTGNTGSRTLVLDPDPSEHGNIFSACVVGYMPARDEITELWLKGDLQGPDSNGHDSLMDGAMAAARATQTVLIEAVKESAMQVANQSANQPHHEDGDEEEEGGGEMEI